MSSLEGGKVREYLVNSAAHSSGMQWFIVSISYQVQDTMYEEVEYHLVIGIAQFEGLFPGSISTDHHIAEKMPVRTNFLSFDLGEGQHIGGSVFASELPVELDHFARLNEGYGQDGCRVTTQVF
jgi:hypothetical protein